MIFPLSKFRFSLVCFSLICLIVPTYYIPLFAVGRGGLALRSFDLVILLLPILSFFAPVGWWEPRRYLVMLFWMGAFAASVAVSTGILFLANHPDEVEVNRIVRAVIRLYETFVLAVVAINAVRHLTVRQAINVILVICAVLPVSSLYTDLTTGGDSTRIGGYAVKGSADLGIEGRFSEQANFNELGALCGALGAGSGGLFFVSKTRRLRIIYLVALLLYTTGTVLTASRSGLLAEAIGLSFAALFLRGSLIWRCLILVVPLVLIATNPRLADIIYGRVFETFLEGSHPHMSASLRIDSMLSAWNVFLAHPCLGVGYAAFRHFSLEGFITPECYYLEILADLGLCGAVAFCGIAVFPVWQGWRLVGEARELFLAAGVVPVVTILVSSVSGNNLFDPSLMMLLLIFLGFAFAQQPVWMTPRRLGIRCGAPRRAPGLSSSWKSGTRP